MTWRTHQLVKYHLWFVRSVCLVLWQISWSWNTVPTFGQLCHADWPWLTSSHLKKVTICPFSHGVLAKKEHIQHYLRQNNSINQPFKTSANHGALSIKSTINDNCAELLYCNYCEHLVTPVQSINVGTLINDNGMKSLTLRTLWHPKRLCGWLGTLRSFLETSTMLWMVLLRSGLLNTADSVD